MKSTRTPWLLLTVILILSAAMTGGCTQSNGSVESGPPIASDCHVYFRYDALGAAGDLPHSALSADR